ncbi:hypothetical protein DPMN_124249 [Dreissena polymorpha]|uniref:Uncharacterized protein n=1 Tax=Dreissena polymorpha TaxID=45954 RepID=A0A9D4JS08_DREPO|nr:hypothetical protein DPMN_124249 [Dreissena polymorpha]
MNWVLLWVIWLPLASLDAYGLLQHSDSASKKSQPFHQVTRNQTDANIHEVVSKSTVSDLGAEPTLDAPAHLAEAIAFLSSRAKHPGGTGSKQPAAKVDNSSDPQNILPPDTPHKQTISTPNESPSAVKDASPMRSPLGLDKAHQNAHISHMALGIDVNEILRNQQAPRVAALETQGSQSGNTHPTMAELFRGRHNVGNVGGSAQAALQNLLISTFGSGGNAQFPFQNFPGSMTQNMLLPNPQPQSQNQDSKPKFVVVKSPTGGFQLVDINQIAKTQTSSQETAVQQPSIYLNQPLLNPVQRVVHHQSVENTAVPRVRPPPPPTEPTPATLPSTTMAPATTSPTTTTSTTTTPVPPTPMATFPTTTITTTTTPMPTTSRMTTMAVPALTTPTIKRTTRITTTAEPTESPNSESGHSTPGIGEFVPQGFRQTFLRKELQKQDLEITKLKLEIRQMREKIGQMPEYEMEGGPGENQPPDFRRMMFGNRMMPPFIAA